MKYKVANPRDIPSGVNIIRFVDEKTGEDTLWYEDDLFEKPKAMKQEVVDTWVQRGFLEAIVE